MGAGSLPRGVLSEPCGRLGRPHSPAASGPAPAAILRRKRARHGPARPPRAFPGQMHISGLPNRCGISHAISGQRFGGRKGVDSRRDALGTRQSSFVPPSPCAPGHLRSTERIAGRHRTVAGVGAEQKAPGKPGRSLSGNHGIDMATDPRPGPDHHAADVDADGRRLDRQPTPSTVAQPHRPSPSRPRPPTDALDRRPAALDRQPDALDRRPAALDRQPTPSTVAQPPSTANRRPRPSPSRPRPPPTPSTVARRPRPPTGPSTVAHRPRPPTAQARRYATRPGGGQPPRCSPDVVAPPSSPLGWALP